MTKCCKCDKTITKEDRDWFGSTPYGELKFCPHCAEEQYLEEGCEWEKTNSDLCIYLADCLKEVDGIDVNWRVLLAYLHGFEDNNYLKVSLVESKIKEEVEN